METAELNLKFIKFIRVIVSMNSSINIINTIFKKSIAQISTPDNNGSSTIKENPFENNNELAFFYLDYKITRTLILSQGLL